MQPVTERAVVSPCTYEPDMILPASNAGGWSQDAIAAVDRPREGGGDAQGRQHHAGQRGHIARDHRAVDVSAGARTQDVVSDGCGGEQGAESQEMERREAGVGGRE